MAARESTSTSPSTEPAPQSPWDRVFTSLPVVFTVIATLLAGLSSSEMSQAQYHRSLAAQHQSKASDQWGFFQAKRMRAQMADDTSELLRGMTHAADFALPPAGTGAGAASSGAASQPAMLTYLTGDALPEVPEKGLRDAAIKATLDAIAANKSDLEIDALAAKIEDAALNVAIDEAVANAAAFDAVTAPINRALDELGRTVYRPLPPGSPPQATAEWVARVQADAYRIAMLRYTARRYLKEARYNQVIALLYEARVHRAGDTSDRHRVRSANFFFAMLAAQAAVTVSTIALAVRRGNALWLLASVAGVIAIAIGVYVYVFM